MRFDLLTPLTLCLWFLAGWAHGFDIEEEVHFPAETPEASLSILSTADRALFAPIIQAFQAANPTISVDYIIAGSSEIVTGIVEEGKTFDLVVSSAMDLQTKLANDGYSRMYRSPQTDLVPDWGRWRNNVFAFTQEPAAIVLSREAFEGQPIPRTREALVAAIRATPEKFENRLGTYDIRASGLGYLFATQDSRISDTFWRFTEVMGNAGTQLYSSSSSMIDDVVSGEIIVAYNVLGSYASARSDVADHIEVIEPEDYTTVMLRSALLMKNSPNPREAEQFLNFLLSLAWETPNAPTFRFPNRDVTDFDRETHLRPIRLGPGLLVHLDSFKRARFLKDWEASVLR